MILLEIVAIFLAFHRSDMSYFKYYY